MSITIRSRSGDQDCSVTTGSFRAWKKRAGRDTAFVLQIPGTDGFFVQTWRDMQAVPPGAFKAKFLQMVAFRRRLHGANSKGATLGSAYEQQRQPHRARVARRHRTQLPCGCLLIIAAGAIISRKRRYMVSARGLRSRGIGECKWLQQNGRVNRRRNAS